MRGILIENPVIFVDMNIPEYSHSQSRRANVTIFCRIRDCIFPILFLILKNKNDCTAAPKYLMELNYDFNLLFLDALCSGNR